MKKTGSVRWSAAVLLLVFWTLFFALSAQAKEGWNRSGKRIWYEKRSETGETVKATGLTKIGKYTYYFSKRGYLKTGWIKRGGKIRFFRMTGKPGVVGRMFVSSCRKAAKVGPYLFGADGVVCTGLHKIKGKWYYFSDSEKIGERGKMVTRSFEDLPDGRRIYLLRTGVMARKRWVVYNGKRYYLGADGNLARNKVTPDGWQVDADGVRTGKASADPSGSTQNTADTAQNAQTAQTEKTQSAPQVKNKGKYETGTKASTGKASILILCGHGQGDPGAGGIGYSEADYTRDFGTRIYNQLKKSGKVNVDIFDKNLDMFQQNRAILNSYYVNGNTLQRRITGSGRYKKKTYNTLKKYSWIPDAMNYDYVLEIHYNAAGVKDYYGNGRMIGVSSYVNSHKSNTALERKIVYALHGLGLPIWAGTPVFGSSTLLNARVYNEMGVSYALLETCFIDDRDDMNFYRRHKNKMAKAVANTIINYFE